MSELVKLYCDLDQVLADFDAGYEAAAGHKPNGGADDDTFWKPIIDTPDFWLNLPMMPDGRELWDYIKSHHYVVILSSPGTHDTERAIRQKRQWVRKHLGDDVNFVPKMAKQKHHYAGPNCILIDDWHKNVKRWLDAGGWAIHHRTAKETIETLKVFGVGLGAYRGLEVADFKSEEGMLDPGITPVEVTMDGQGNHLCRSKAPEDPCLVCGKKWEAS